SLSRVEVKILGYIPRSKAAAPATCAAAADVPENVGCWPGASGCPAGWPGKFAVLTPSGATTFGLLLRISGTGFAGSEPASRTSSSDVCSKRLPSRSNRIVTGPCEENDSAWSGWLTGTAPTVKAARAAAWPNTVGAPSYSTEPGVLS